MPTKLNDNLAVVAGAISGATAVHVWGENPDVDQADDPEDLWDGGGEYTYTAAGGATYYISSSSTSDTMDVTVTLLTEDSDGDWNLETFDVTVPGQTKTSIATDIPSGDDPVRLLSIVNASGTDTVGDVYIYEDDTVTTGVPDTAAKVRGKIIATQPRTYMAMYTIPTGYTGYLVKRACGLGNATATTCDTRFKTRAEGGDFHVDARINLDNSVLARQPEVFPLPVAIAAKTDIKWTAETVAADNSAVTGEFDLVLLG